MGQYDIFIIGGVAVVGGWYVYTHPEILNSLFPPVTDPPVVDGETPPPTDGEDGGNGGGDGDGGDGGNGGGDGSYDCARACRNCWCKSYSEKCGGSCSRCCGGSRIASKCGGQGVKTCSSSNLAFAGQSYPYGGDMRLSIA